MSQEQPPKNPAESGASSRIKEMRAIGSKRLQSGAVDLTARVKEFNTKEAIDAVLDAPVRLKR